jgi:protein-disulfide isomerase
MRILFALLALLTLALPAAAQAQRGRDWTRTIVRTPEGGYRMGNPAAPVKLVEYGSITCSHCAEFAATGNAPLRTRYVATGRVSFEYRPYLIFPTDPGLFLLLGCLGPARFFDASDQLYASQRVWLSRVLSLSPAEQERIEQLPPARQAAALIGASGLDPFFRQRGLTAAQANACLNNAEALRRLAAISAHAANTLGVQGTPTFFVNGRQVPVNSWAGLEPLLRAR